MTGPVPLTDRRSAGRRGKFLAFMSHGDRILSTDFKLEYDKFNGSGAKGRDVCKMLDMSYGTFSNIMWDTHHQTLDIEKARRLLYTVIDLDLDVKGATERHVAVRRKQADVALDIRLRRLKGLIGICNYLTAPNLDFPTKDLITAEALFKVLATYSSENENISFPELDSICGFITGTFKFLCESNFITYLNYDVVAHIVKRLIGHSTTPTDYERHRFKNSDYSYALP